jgi:hypothetical protein
MAVVSPPPARQRSSFAAVASWPGKIRPRSCQACDLQRTKEESFLTTPNDSTPKKKRLTPTYIVFHILFSEDTWRVAIGIALAVVSAPMLRSFDHTGIGRYVMFVTVVVLGWAISKTPSLWIIRQIRLLFPNR